MNKIKLLPWIALFELTLLSLYSYFGLEWIFFVTKPSFLNVLPFLNQLGILGLSVLVFTLLSVPVLLLLLSASLLFRGPAARLAPWLGGLIPAVFFASTGLMFVDNFTYTIFRFGVVKTSGLGRGVYGALFALFLVICLVWTVKQASSKGRKEGVSGVFRQRLVICACLLGLSIPLGVRQFFTAKSASAAQATTIASRRPNILLIGSDGLDANHMSLYGYQRDTTPFLRELAKTSLLSENNFPNASITTGSLVSMYTGKLPTTTRVLYPPDILQDSEAVQHLPGILKSAGYFNADITVDYYGDSAKLNMQDSFVMTNGHTLVSGTLYDLVRQVLPEDESYFLSIIGTRLTERVMHIFYLHKMGDPYAEVTQKLNTWKDQDRINQIMYTFQHSPQPVFLHVHMMGTHEGNLDPHNDTFSQGEKFSEETEWDFYDNTVLDFDGYMKKVVDGLSQMGILENTVIILYTDHGYSGVSNVRIPLMFHFPGGENSGRLGHNTQNLDIAPSILDYLGIQQPAWMAGQSLLKGEPPSLRPIFSAAPGNRYHNEEGRLQINTSQLKAPFYQFSMVSMVICQKYYELKTGSMALHVTDIQDYPAPCRPADLPGNLQARQMMMDQLKRDGFQIP